MFWALYKFHQHGVGIERSLPYVATYLGQRGSEGRCAASSRSVPSTVGLELRSSAMTYLLQR